MVLAQDLLLSATLTLHAQTPASELLPRVSDMLKRGGVVVEGVMRLRRWNEQWALPEQPISDDELTGDCTLCSLGLAPRGAVLLEMKPVRTVHSPCRQHWLLR